MIKLYHSKFTRSLRVRWLLEEMGLEYEIQPVDFAAKDHKSDAFLKVNPFGSMPAFEDGDLKMFESGAILTHLMDKYDDNGLRPKPGTSASAQYLPWFFFGEASLQPYLSIYAQHTMFLAEEDRVAAVAATAKQRATDYITVMDGFLTAREYIAGDTFSAADIMCTYPLVLCHLFGILPNENLPNVEAYYERMSAREAFKIGTSD